MTRTKAFTLIELLFTAAIISVLAAIALPNFLEARTRARTARAASDLRTLAGAIEGYAVDHNQVIPGTAVATYMPNCVSGPLFHPNATAQSWLTTPIAYLAAIPKDPFRLPGQIQDGGLSASTGEYEYASNTCRALVEDFPQTATARSVACGYAWLLMSIGPARRTDRMEPQPLNDDYDWQVVTGEFLTPPAAPAVAAAYDPTNGSVSDGWIIRTNKGPWTRPGE